MSLSVILPYRDAAPTLGEALASVLADLAPDDEVVAVDDGSRDHGARIVAAYAARDRRVRAIEAAGTGIVAALRAGVAAATGDLVARMDADDVSLPGRFAASRAWLEADPSLAAVGTRIEAFVDVPGAEPADGTKRYVAWQNALVTKDDHARAIYVESPLCHPSTTMRRAALDAVGGYRETPWAEDWDLWLRMHHAGFGLAKVPRVLLRWRRHARSVTATDPRQSMEALLRARAAYLAAELAHDARPFAIWGAGRTGRRLARALEAHGVRAAFFVDIDPKKRIARDLAVLPPDDGVRRLRRDGARLVVAVGTPGARDVVRARIARMGLLERRDFVCAA